MEDKSKGFLKYCIVPMCTSTSVNSPSKLFFSVPRHDKKRRKWCQIMKRKPLSSVTNRYCCEDHFDIEKDMLNYWECKLVGANPRLKLDVVPHKFACQKSERSLVAERPYAAKRRRLEVIQEAFEWREAQQQSDECRASTSFQKPEENVQLREFEAFIRHETQLLSHECIPSTSFQKAEENVELHEFDEQSETASKSIQVNIHSHYRSKSTMTSRHCTSKNVALSPIKAKMIDESTSPIKIKSSINILSSSDSASLSISTDDSFIADSVEESSNCSFDEEISKESFDGKIRECTLMAIEKNSRLFLGIPENSYHLIDLLSQNIPCRLLNVLITLKKIRLDDSFAVLAVHFGMSLSNISRIFKNTMPVMALQLEKLLYWPKPEQIRLHLPIPFRARYNKVVSIIDCLELQIEKPSDPVHQALSWSQYKSCNTIKYLISCTPDGLVNFISCGYGGRATDALIVEDCNYLDNLDPGLSVMADRGFKNIAHLLKQRGCELIRPPSVSKDIASTKEEVKSAKRIAALRIHIERVIGRLREFEMLLPHACIDNHMIQYMDYVIKIACGVINLQGHLINIQL